MNSQTVAPTPEAAPFLWSPQNSMIKVAQNHGLAMTAARFPRDVVKATRFRLPSSNRRSVRNAQPPLVLRKTLELAKCFGALLARRNPSAWLRDRIIEPIEILLDRNLNASELQHVIIRFLTIEKRESTKSEYAHKFKQAELRTVGTTEFSPRKHALAEKRRADADAIQAPHEHAAMERFHGMRKSDGVESFVSRDHARRDPIRIVIMAIFRTRANDAAKRGVDSDLKRHLLCQPRK